MTAVQVRPSPVRGSVAAPGSKSITNRVLLIAALADGSSLLRAPLRSDDSAAMRDAVSAFGATVDETADGWRVSGTAGRLRVPDVAVHTRLSGTTMRFVTAAATLAPGPSTITGAPALLRRSVGPLVDALRSAGAALRSADGGLPPVHVEGGGLRGGRVSVNARGSSQFASALLLVAPYAAHDVIVTAEGDAAFDYVALTADVMRAWGAQVDQHGERSWHVRAGGYRPRDYTVEYDASAAAHLLALAVASGGTVTVTNATRTRQPDARIVEVFEALGAHVQEAPQEVTVSGAPQLRPVDLDLSAIPDQVTTVAVLAALAPGVSTLRNVAVARGHETDRLTALATELRKVGVQVEERPDGLRIHGGSPRGPARLATYDDHRLAMAFAALATRIPGVSIADPGCVAKTYPGFWSDLEALGVQVEERP